MRPYQSPGNFGPNYYYPPYQANIFANYSQYVENKDVVVALLLALLLPGAGHMYAGEMKKGVLILAFFIIVGLATFLMWLTTIWSMGTSGPAPFAIVVIIALVIILIAWLYQVYDACQAAQRYNDSHGPSRF